jgi:ketosteroid isomerase-like protein
MSQENVEIVQELYERFAETDFERLREVFETSSSLDEAAPQVGELGRWQLDHLDSEVELDASALPTLPDGSNVARGHQGWFDFWRAWLIPWERFEYTPKRWRDTGDRVVVELVQRGRLAGGLVYATPISNVWTFEDERVVRLQMFETWTEALDAAGLSE